MSTPRKPDDLDLMLVLADAMSGGSGGRAIEAAEARGQYEMVSSTVLPAEFDSGSEDELTALGFKLGDKVEGDPLFRRAELPPGWKREGSDHAMWSHVVDELGRKRINIFFKAAFYDRRAGMSVNSVYSYVGECNSEGRQPVLDDQWATSEAVVEAAQGQQRQARKYLDMYDNDESSDYARERAAELRSEICAAQALIDSLSAADSPKGDAA